MKTIDLKEIIEKRNLDVKDIAQQLFPSNKYPKFALNRILAGEAVLDANQISKLALITGLSIGDLYETNSWKAVTENGIFTFTCDEFKAELNTNDWTTKVFHNNSMFHESIISSGSIPLSQYFTELNLIVNKYQSNVNN